MPKVIENCETCDRPPASDEEWDTISEGEGEHLCWGDCYRYAVDWRARALAAEALLAKENIDA